MRISLRKKVGISILFTFLVLCLSLFALSGAGKASAHGSTRIAPVPGSANTSTKPAHHSLGCSSSAHFFAAPCTATETTVGNVSFALIGQRLIPITAYAITSPTLIQACLTGTNVTQTVITDFEGRFNTTVFGSACIRGTYEIELQDTSSPFTVYSTHITIKTP